jgi:hypothetical protein
MKRMLLALMSWVFAINSAAVETDQYMAWKVELPDSAEAINGYLNTEIAAAVAKINNEKKLAKFSCEDVTAKILSHIKGKYEISRVSAWTSSSDQVARFPDDLKRLQYAKQSIYRYSSTIISASVDLAKTINVDGYYFGTDKIGHIFYMGRHYYDEYLKAINNKWSHIQAVRFAIDKGIASEQKFLGYIVGGVFSYADLEANYQGLLLALDFCQGDQPYLSQTEDKQFVFNQKLDIRKYVNADFDESFNPNYYGPNKIRTVRKMISRNYCSEYQSNEVQARFQSYRARYQESFNRKYVLSKLKHTKFVKGMNNQSILAICEGRLTP